MTHDDNTVGRLNHQMPKLVENTGISDPEDKNTAKMSGRERADQMIRKTEELIGKRESTSDTIDKSDNDVRSTSLLLKMESEFL